MGSIAKDKNQITLFYSSKNSLGKQIDAYVASSEKATLSVDISKTTVTAKQWAEIADGLGIEIKGLIGTDYPDFKKEYGKGQKDLEANDWLKILENNPHLLKHPIAINGSDYLVLKTAASFKKYMENDSEGVKYYE
ncbi:MAG: hypothetical protein WBB27_18350 [Maribacter sp.]|jgi:arsenate reductase-like glutaredoxin family protein